MINQGLEEFAAAREQFGRLLSTLQSEQMLRNAHSWFFALLTRTPNRYV